MNRRFFVGSLAAALSLPVVAMPQYASTPGLQASPTGIVILQLVNFYCARSNQVNASYERMFNEARKHGVDLRVAPCSWDKQSPWPDRMFYAIRDLYPGFENAYRDLMFDGVHSDGLRYESVEQVMSNLDRRGFIKKALELNPNFKISDVASHAASEDIQLAQNKALRLLVNSKAIEVPVFIWLKDGQPLKTLTPETVGGDPRQLVQHVLEFSNPANLKG